MLMHMPLFYAPPAASPTPPHQTSAQTISAAGYYLGVVGVHLIHPECHSGSGSGTRSGSVCGPCPLRQHRQLGARANNRRGAHQRPGYCHLLLHLSSPPRARLLSAGGPTPNTTLVLRGDAPRCRQRPAASRQPSAPVKRSQGRVVVQQLHSAARARGAPAVSARWTGGEGTGKRKGVAAAVLHAPLGAISNGSLAVLF
jgi:hypothetical protein